MNKITLSSLCGPLLMFGMLSTNISQAMAADETLKDVKTTLTRDFPQMRIALRRDRIGLTELESI